MGNVCTRGWRGPEILPGVGPLGHQPQRSRAPTEPSIILSPHLLVAPRGSTLPPSSSIRFLLGSAPSPAGLALSLSHRTPLPSRGTHCSSGPPAPSEPRSLGNPPNPLGAARALPLQPLSPQGRIRPRLPAPFRPGLSFLRPSVQAPFRGPPRPGPGAPLTHQRADLGPAPAPGSRCRGSASLRPPHLSATPPPQADPGSYCSFTPSR